MALVSNFRDIGVANSTVDVKTPTDYSSYFNVMSDMTRQANELNLASARETNEFNRIEAEKNRQWQEYMSNTAHQREVEDLIKAGLNPVLSARLGGAAVTSGSSASGQKAQAESGVGAFASLLGALLNQETALITANINAQTQQKYFDTMEKVANINISQPNSVAGSIWRIFDKLADILPHDYKFPTSSKDVKYDKNGRRIIEA